MKPRVALVEFSIFDQFPLISGYLHGYACKAPEVAETFEFVYYQREIAKVDYAETVKSIRSLNARIVCLSAYVWNIGLIRRLVRDLLEDKTIEHIVLGGHQISHQLSKYIGRDDNKSIVINGQGEIAFRSTLCHLSSSHRMKPMTGVSFFDDGEICDGGEAEMLKSLDDIPSPYLGGLFDNCLYPTAIIETNRGCPFQCTFCTWGGDTMRVTKFATDRVKDELLWLAKRSVPFLYLADANWGILPRDIEISDYIASLKRAYGAPWGIYYAATKNKPKGSIACIEKLYNGGVITSQALGIQSMNPAVLDLVKRKNISNDDFIEMFKQLSERNIDSYCELIWPLPGETLETLKSGFEALLDVGARTVILYPSLLINNSELQKQAEEFGMKHVLGQEWMSELRIVKETRFADERSVEQGFWFYYAFFVLANCDFHKALLRYFRSAHQKPAAALITEFSRYLQHHVGVSAYAAVIQNVFDAEDHGTLLTIGRIAAHLTHEHRSSAILDVAKFLDSAASHENLTTDLPMIVLWAASFPRLFSDTPEPIAQLVDDLRTLYNKRPTAENPLFGIAVDVHRRSITIDVDDTSGCWSNALKYFGQHPHGGIGRICITHPQSIFVPFDPINTQKSFQYAHGMIERLGMLAPRIEIDYVKVCSAA